MKTVHIGKTDWHKQLANAIRLAKEDTIIVVDSNVKRELGLLVIERLAPVHNITIQVG